MQHKSDLFLFSYSVALVLSVLTGQRPPEGVDVKGNRMGGVSWHASSAGQLMDVAERLGEVCLLLGGYTKLRE